jgi:SAM-dependent methyltransferase
LIPRTKPEDFGSDEEGGVVQAVQIDEGAGDVTQVEKSKPSLDYGEKYTLLDAGCGVGNGFYPLYREYSPRLKVHACDFSPRAVEFAKQHELYNKDEINVNVCDLVNDPQLPFPPNSAHFGICLFVLSAISPEN